MKHDCFGFKFLIVFSVHLRVATYLDDICRASTQKLVVAFQAHDGHVTYWGDKKLE